MIALLMPSPWEVHPALVHFPIAFLLAGVTLDFFAWWRLRRPESPPEVAAGLLFLTQLASGLLIAGVLTGVLALLTGFVAYVTVPLYMANADIVLNWHLGVTLSSLTLFGLGRVHALARLGLVTDRGDAGCRPGRGSAPGCRSGPGGPFGVPRGRRF